MDIAEIKDQYYNGVSDIALSKKYNIPLKKLRVLLLRADNPNSPKIAEEIQKEKRCNYCNEPINSRKKYCENHKDKKQRTVFEYCSVEYSRLRVKRHCDISYDNPYPY